MIQVELIVALSEIEEVPLVFKFESIESIEQENFVKLAQSGFYDNCPIFRIERGFLALSGDPTGTGKSGSQSYFDLSNQPPITSKNQVLQKVKVTRGSLGLLRGSKSGKVGSQFFIMLSDAYPEMAKKHAIIGHTDTNLEKLEQVRCNFEGRPLTEIIIKSASILNSPFLNVISLRRERVVPLPSNNKRELTEVERQVIERAYEAQLPIDLDATLSTCTLYIGNLNPKSDARELQCLLESKLECKLKKYTNKHNYAFIEFSSLEECDRAFKRLKDVVIDDFKIKVDYHFPNLPINKCCKKLKS